MRRPSWADGAQPMRQARRTQQAAPMTGHTPSTNGHTMTPSATAPRLVPATAPRPKRQTRRRQHAAPKLGRRRPAYAADPKDAASGAHDGSDPIPTRGKRPK